MEADMKEVRQLEAKVAALKAKVRGLECDISDMLRRHRGLYELHEGRALEAEKQVDDLTRELEETEAQRAEAVNQVDELTRDLMVAKEQAREVKGLLLGAMDEHLRNIEYL